MGSTNLRPPFPGPIPAAVSETISGNYGIGNIQIAIDGHAQAIGFHGSIRLMSPSPTVKRNVTSHRKIGKSCCPVNGLKCHDARIT